MACALTLVLSLTRSPLSHHCPATLPPSVASLLCVTARSGGCTTVAVCGGWYIYTREGIHGRPETVWSNSSWSTNISHSRGTGSSSVFLFRYVWICTVQCLMPAKIVISLSWETATSDPLPLSCRLPAREMYIFIQSSVSSIALSFHNSFQSTWEWEISFYGHVLYWFKCTV